jgi:hypothetical protein
MPDERDDEIRERAYAIWQREGEPGGRARDHWEQARREIEAEQVPAKAARLRKSKPKAAADETPATESGAKTSASRRRKA